MTKPNIFKYFKTSPEIIRLAVMYYVRFPLSFRQVEDILHERGIDICNESVRFWGNRIGGQFAKEIRNKREGYHSIRQCNLDEVVVKINGERFYLWWVVGHEGEVLECYVSKRRDKRAAKKILIKTIRKHGSPHIITTDKLPSYRAVFCEFGFADRQLCGGRTNNRCENSHLPFRRQKRAMQRFRSHRSLQTFSSMYSQIYNHFNHHRHLENRHTFKAKRETVFSAWYQICA